MVIKWTIPVVKNFQEYIKKSYRKTRKMQFLALFVFFSYVLLLI